MMRIGYRWNEVLTAATDRTRPRLEDGTYRFHPLLHMIRHEPKERIIDYAGDRDKEMLTAVHKAITVDLAKKISPRSFSSIKGRGLTKCAKVMSRLVRRHQDGYYLQIDIRKYYASIDHGLLKDINRRYIKDAKVLDFLDRMIDNHNAATGKGIAIGLSLSSYEANLYLTDIDRWLSEQMHTDHVRYMDDIVVFADSKEQTQQMLVMLRQRIEAKGLDLKQNVRIAPVSRGIIFIGYKFYPTHTLLRKNIRERMKARHRQLEKKGASDEEYKRKMAPYFGWCIHANCLHLLKKTMGKRYKLFEKNVMDYKRLKDKKTEQNWFGLPRESRESILTLVGKEVVIFESQEVEVMKEKKAVFRYCYPDNEEEIHYSITRSETMRDRLLKDSDQWPAIVTFIEKTAKNGRKYICYE